MLGHPRATINFPLFHDLARGRRLMLTYTVFASANRSIRLAYEAFPLRSLQLKWNCTARRRPKSKVQVNRSEAVAKSLIK